jgi:hypothetical protein
MNEAILDLQQILKPSTKTMYVRDNRKCTSVNSKNLTKGYIWHHVKPNGRRTIIVYKRYMLNLLLVCPKQCTMQSRNLGDARSFEHVTVSSVFQYF